MKSLFKLGSTSVSIRIGRMGLGVLSNAALARLMAPHDFGVLAFAIATTTLIAIPGEGGMTSLATREVVKKRVSNDLPGLRGFIYFANATVLSLSLTSVLIAALIVGILWTVSPDVRYPTLMVTLGSVIFGPMANTRAGILRGLGSPILSQIPEQIIRPGMLTLIAATAFFLGYRSIAPEWGAAMYLTSSAIAFAVGTAVLVIYYKRHVPSGDRVVQTREWLSSLLPFSLVAAVQVAMGQTAMVVLGMVRPPTDTAIFRIVTLIGDVVGFSVLALGVLEIGRAHV